MVTPGVGLCRGPLRSRTAHRSRWSRPFHPLRITPATADTRRASCRAGQPTRPDSPATTPPSHPQPPAAVLQKHRAPIQQQPGPASFPKVSPPPHDTCPAPEARKGHRLPPPPFSVAAVSGDAGLPARKRPPPGISQFLLIPRLPQPQARPGINQARLRKFVASSTDSTAAFMPRLTPGHPHRPGAAPAAADAAVATAAEPHKVPSGRVSRGRAAPKPPASIQG